MRVGPQLRERELSRVRRKRQFIGSTRYIADSQDRHCCSLAEEGLGVVCGGRLDIMGNVTSHSSSTATIGAGLNRSNIRSLRLLLKATTGESSPKE